MQLVDAVRIVAADIRASYPGMTIRQAIMHTQSAIIVPSLNEDDESTYVAYKLVLEATVSELEMAIIDVMIAIVKGEC